MTSSFPAADNPGVAVDVYRGDLGMESGRSQSVFSIDTNQVDKGALVKQARSNLMPGESITLDDGTVITFTGYNEWVSLQTSYDPAQGWALVFAVTLLIGLMISLVIKRRRVWFRHVPVRGGSERGPCASGCGRPYGGGDRWAGPDRPGRVRRGIRRTGRVGRPAREAVTGPVTGGRDG